MKIVLSEKSSLALCTHKFSASNSICKILKTQQPKKNDQKLEIYIGIRYPSVQSGAENPPLRVDLPLNKGGAFRWFGPRILKFFACGALKCLAKPLHRALKYQNFRACGGLTTPQAIFSVSEGY